MYRASTLLFVICLAGAARAEEPVLETIRASELLGEELLGLPMPDAHLWDGDLAGLAEAVDALGGAVELAKGVDGSLRVHLVCNERVGADLARRSVDVAARRAGYETQDQGDRLTIGSPEDTGVHPPDVQVMITVVGADAVGAMASFYRRYQLAGPDALIVEVPELGAVVLATTSEAMEQPVDFTEWISPAQSAPVDTGVEEIEEGHYRVERRAVTSLVDDAARAARILPSYREDELHGYKVFSIRRGSALSNLRIRNGDVLIRHDGEAIATAAALDRLLIAWLTADAVELAVERRGREQTLHYEMTGDPVEVPPLFSATVPTRAQHREHHGVVETDDAVVVPRSYVLALRQGPLQEVRWVYSLDDDGAVRGLRGSSASGSLLHVLGVDRSARLAAVDGHPIGSPETLMALFTALRSQSEVRLTLCERDSCDDLVLQVQGDPDPDTTPWPLDLLSVAPTLSERRKQRGIESSPAGLRVPREVVAELLDPATTWTLSPDPPTGDPPDGYRLSARSLPDALELVGLARADSLVAIDGEALRSRASVEAAFTRMLTYERTELTIRSRGGTERLLALEIVGEPLTAPSSWALAGLDIDPTLTERRTAAGIVVEGDRLVVPRQLIVEQGRDLMWLLLEDGRSEVPRWRAPRLQDLLGLRSGDVLVAFDDHSVVSTEALTGLVSALHTQPAVVLHLQREGEAIDVRVDLDGEPAEPPDPASLRSRPRER